MAALIYVFTAFLHVPSYTGYTHSGDGTDFAEQARLAAEKMRTQILGYVTVL